MNLTIFSSKGTRNKGLLANAVMHTVIDVLDDVMTHLGKKKIHPAVILNHQHGDHTLPPLPRRAYNSRILIPGRSQSLMNLPRKKQGTLFRQK